MLSSACAYGLRAALYLASLKEEGYVPIRRLSDELDISFPFLTKIFQQLTQAGLLTSHRGPRGGVAFTRPPGQITLKEIITAIDGPDLFEACVLGLPGCGEQKPCPLHAAWATERARLDALFADTTLADMADRIDQFDVRLTARMAS
ncbi:MAG: Rrf2 family transcriptional regulator [Bacteroidetes bacterium]|nr:transcriptional regulator [Rhodothermaceae bacterium RA]RMH69359.1 MAG: Rrf2 family transcriptional regulator [Bacteroidota bacterium]